MKSMLKKLFLSFIGSAMLVMFTAAGASAISVTVDGAPVSFDTEPVMINDRIAYNSIIGLPDSPAPPPLSVRPDQSS